MLKGSYISESEIETEKIAKLFVEEFLKKREKTVVFLLGELGSGKTTFVRYALKHLGIPEKEFEGSPTFTVVNVYEGNIYHIDLYRMQTDEEIEGTGVEELLEKNQYVVFIEWPEKLKIRPDICIEIKQTKEQQRIISFDKC